MTEDNSAGSGAANTPPFPRSYDPDAPLPPPHSADLGGPGSDSAPNSEREPAARERKGGPGETRREGAARISGEIGRRAQRTLYHSIGHIADQLEDVGGRLDRLADERLHALGPRVGRAAGAAGSAAGWLNGAADYLRSSELPDFQQDLERQVREKPLQSLLVAVGAGWLLGKIIR